MKLPAEVMTALIQLEKEKGVRLEGNILKVLESDDSAFSEYLQTAIERDKDTRRKRLEITRQVQSQNAELQKTKEELEDAILQIENAKSAVEADLNVLQQKTQFRLMQRATNAALFVVSSVGLVTTAVYMYALSKGQHTEQIGSVWSSMVGILVTNSFSILGTIIGVKYGSEKTNS